MSRLTQESFRRNLAEHALIPPGARVLVGVSGGADSLCLLHLLHAEGIDIVAAHLHHGLREEADHEQEVIGSLAEKLGIPFVAGRADVGLMSRELKLTIEEAGRHARYAFFRSALNQTQSHLIATAHTQDDHVETILFNLARGTGRAGLTGIPRRRENIIRPILDFRRSETHDYCRDAGLEWFSDPANEDLTFSRARIRHRVMQELEIINPQFRDSISHAADTLRAEDDLLDGMAASMLEACEIRPNGDLWWLTSDCEVILDVHRLTTHPRALVARGIRLATGVLGGILDHTNTSLILKGLADGHKGSVTCEGGVVEISWTNQRLHLRQSHPTAPFRFPVSLPGETESVEFGWTITAELQAGAERRGLGGHLDQSKIAGSLHLRGVESGDRIAPVGLGGTKLISDILQEMKLSRAARARLPIICDMVGPVWIPFGPIAERVKVEADTKRQVILNLSQSGDPVNRAVGP